MTDLGKLLTGLRKRGIRLWLQNDRLRYEAPEGALDDHLLDRLKSNKNQLVAFLKEAQNATATPSPPIEPIPRDTLLALSSAQKRLWFLDRLEGQSPSYHIPFGFRLEGPLCSGALEDSLRRIIERHEVLRTRFEEKKGKPVQVIDHERPTHLGLIDLSGLNPGVRETLGRRLAKAQALNPFNLKEGPHLRVCLVRWNPTCHFLLCNLHHIVADGWSLGVLTEELARLYETELKATGMALPPLPIQYGDYAAWQHHQRWQKAYQTQIRFWKQYLFQAPEVLALPTDRPRTYSGSPQGDSVALAVDAQTTEALIDLTRKANASLFITLLAAWGVFLSRYARSDDVVIGCPHANRDREELEGLIGFFINITPFRLNVSGDPSFFDFLMRVKNNVLKVDQFRELPFEEIVEAVQPARNANHHPLVQVLFSLQNAPAGTLDLLGIEVSGLDTPIPAAKVDLSLEISQRGEGLSGIWIFRTDLFEPSTVERMNTHFLNELKALSENPHVPLSRITFLDAEETHRLLGIWNQTKRPPTSQGNVLQWIEGQVRRTPSAIAITDHHPHESPHHDRPRYFSYGFLDQMAAHLAQDLNEQGVTPESLVGVLSDRSAEMVVAFLAILKAGGAYLPLDTQSPSARIKQVLAQAGVNIVVAKQKLRPLLPQEDTGIRVLRADFAKGNTIRLRGRNKKQEKPPPQQAAYAIFTSGSTGTPKGVLLTHGGLANLVDWHHRTYQVTENDQATQVASAVFDASVWELWPYLCGGACVHIISKDLAADGKRYWDLVRSKKITLSFVPTPFVRELLEHAPPTSSLRTMLTGGDRLRLKPATSFPFALINHYGPTEGTVVTTCHSIVQPPSGLAPPIGRPIDHTRVYVVDSFLRPTPTGLPGELVMGGKGLARGYIGKPGWTAAAFVPDPFNRVPGSRLYRTGDLVRFDEKGQIHFLGRNDHQVKIRGLRIELEEIEAALVQITGIKQAVVVHFNAADREHRGELLAAYLVPERGLKNGRPPDHLKPKRICSLLEKNLPNYMVPSRFHFMKRFPLNAAEKVDRKQLPKLKDMPTTRVIPPRNPIEAALFQIWEEVLNRKPAGVFEDFFAAGGHSLATLRLVARIRDVFAKDISVKDLFTATTIAHQSSLLEKSKQRQQKPILGHRPLNTPVPLSFSQQRFWFLEQLRNPEDPKNTYVISTAMVLKGFLNVAALAKSIRGVLERHEILRLQITGHNGVPVPRVMSTPEQGLQVIDINGLGKSYKEGVQTAILRAEHRRGFPLDQPLTPRVILLRANPKCHFFMASMHHIIADGWSFGIFVKELSESYQAHLREETRSLPNLPFQYADFAHWQRNVLKGRVLKRYQAFWKRYMEGAPPLLDLPTDRPRSSTPSHRGALLPVSIDRNITRGLFRLARKGRATVFMALQAAMGALLARYSGQQEVVLGSPTANRDISATENMVGCFVNTLAFRIDCGGNPSFGALLNRVRQRAIEVFDHQDLPFELLVALLDQPRNANYSPIFQAMLSFNNTPEAKLDLPGLKAVPLELPRESALFDLTLTLDQVDEDLIGSVEYNTGLFDKSTIERWTAHFQNFLVEVIKDPSCPLSQIELMGKSERHQLLTIWSGAASFRPENELCLDWQTLFGREWEARADSGAIIGYLGSSDQFEVPFQITLMHLIDQAQRIACRLRAMGVRPNDVVLVYSDRPHKMLLGFLAVLAAGGVYLPVEPGNPPHRLAYLLGDAKPSVILTSEAFGPVFSASRGRLLFWEGMAQFESGTLPPKRFFPCPDSSAAYLIYTSGSTGDPKGVAVGRRTIIRHSHRAKQAYEVTSRDKMLQFSSFQFDATLDQVLPALASGAILVLRGQSSWHPDTLATAMHRWGITIIDVPPTYWNACLQSWSEKGKKRPFFPKLRLVILGGEAVTGELMQLHNQLFKQGPQLINAYGPTETTVTACIGHLNSSHHNGAISIGRPMEGRRVYVVDAFLNLVPPGVVGELLLGGEGLARGYWNRPRQTAMAFVPDPFVGGGKRIYRTGDRVRFFADGFLEHFGRLDRQLKIRGFRVEPGEIEAALKRFPGIQRAVVTLGLQNRNHGLMAYVTLKAQTNANPSTTGLASFDSVAVREFLLERLPGHMVPAVVTCMETFPLTPSGKIDIRALPEPKPAGPETALTPMETEIASHWTEVLGVTPQDPRDHFFQMGGHSLAAIKLISKINARHGVSLTLRDLFENATLNHQANLVAQQMEQLPTKEQPVWVPVDRHQPLVVSAAQRRLWFLHQLGIHRSAYHIPAWWQFKGPLDAPALEEAVVQIVGRHEVLRTTFCDIKGEPHQVVHERVDFSMPVIDLSAIEKESRDHLVEKWQRRQVIEDFDLQKGPLFRVAVFQCGVADHHVISTMHHLVSDDWSTGIWVREIAHFYREAITQRPALLPNLSFQYADFAAWQNQKLGTTAYQNQISYWKRQLAGAPSSLSLPFDEVEAEEPALESKEWIFYLDQDVKDGCLRLAKGSGGTVFTVLQAAFALLLQRYSGQRDLVVGTPIANRTVSQVEPLIGCFLNTLALRFDLGGNPTLWELCGRVKGTVLDGFDHSDVPFEQVVEAVQPERHLDQSPIFQVMLIVQPPVDPVWDLPGLQTVFLNSSSGPAKFPLTLAIVEERDRFFAMVRYDPNRFCKKTIQRLAEHWQVLLANLVKMDPNLPVAQCRHTSPEERQRLLDSWHVGEVKPSPANTILSLCGVAGPLADTIAVQWADPDGKERFLSFSALQSRIIRLASHLARRGIGPEKPVVVYMNRCPEMVVAVWAVLEAGGYYVMMAPSAPADRSAAQLAALGNPTILTKHAMRQAPGLEGYPMVTVDRPPPGKTHDMPGSVAKNALAYVLFTSGSTGKPKPVAVTRASLLNLVHGLNKTVYEDFEDRPLKVALNGPLIFDTTVKQFFQMLSGRRLILLNEKLRYDGHHFLNYVNSRKVDSLDLTPSQLALLLQVGLGQWSPPPFRMALVGGEPIDSATWRLLVQMRDCRFYNLYGPTECTVDTTVTPILGTRPHIGRPLANVCVRVLDSTMELTSQGLAGELHIGGAGLARGYQIQPAATAARFVPDPFAQTPGQRLYKTGDWVRFQENGNLVFLHRLDRQIKIRGIRIDLGEIEAALRAFPGVTGAVVLHQEGRALRGAGRSGILVAYFTIEKRCVDGPGPSIASPSAEALRKFVNRRLPEATIPALYRLVSSFPLTPSGKIDYKSLARDAVLPGMEPQATAPRDAVEAQMALIWAEALGIDHIGVEDSFFEMGGHSLMATKILARIRKTFGVEPELRVIFQKPTIRAFARYVTALNQPRLFSHGPVPLTRGPGGRCPLSFVQQRMWFNHHWEDSPAHLYNMPAVYRLSGPLDLSSMAASLGSIAARHENLRTTFEEIEGKPTGNVLDSFLPPVSVLDLSGLDEEERSVTRMRILNRWVQKNLLSKTVPPWTVALVRYNDQAHLLLLNFHHIIVDGWSMGLFFRELCQIYRHHTLGHPPVPGPLPIQFADYAHWQNQQLKGDNLNTLVSYWKHQLAEAPERLELPLIQSRPAVQTFAGASHHFRLNQKYSTTLEQLARKSGMTLFALLQSAFGLLLSRYSGQSQVVVGTPIANRMHMDVEPLIGCFINTLALRMDFGGNPFLPEFLGKISRVILDAHTHSELPFEKLVEALKPQRLEGVTPIFQVMFALENNESQPVLMPGLSIESVDVPHQTAKFDLTLVMLKANGRLSGSIEYNRDLFSSRFVERLAEHLINLLRAMAEAPNAKIDQLSLLRKSQQKIMIENWNHTAAPFPKNQGLDYLFEKITARTPHRIAVSFESNGKTGNCQMTYRALDVAAQNLAVRLLRRGVSPDQTVGICAHRSAHWIAGILAILKAGGAYVPLDPALPKQRLLHMVKDAGIKTLLVAPNLVDHFEDLNLGQVLLDIDGGSRVEFAPQKRMIGTDIGEHLAYVVYTSGSTGGPKGVAVSHRAVCRLVFRNRFLSLTPAVRMAQASNAAFDAATFEIWGCLLHGGRLEAVPLSLLSSPQRLETHIAKRHIEVLFVTTALFNTIARETPTAFHKLRVLLFGGEAVNPSWVHRITQQGSPGKLLHVYGPTESTTFASWFQIREVDARANTLSIGKPIGNTQCYLLDKTGALVPPYIAGELVIGGEGLARGYLGQPALTADRFRPNGYSGIDGSRLYHTGDRAQYDDKGNIYFLGRLDQQIKLRGFRIEPAEIETHLQRHPTINNALVRLEENESGDKRLIAYCEVGESLEKQSHESVEDREMRWRLFLKQSLPDYMVPSTFIVMTQMPLNTHGKINRAALPLPPTYDLAPRSLSPSDPLEETVAHIWAEVLNKPRVNLSDNFFDLGGHSLLATQVIARVRASFSLEVPIKTLFTTPTLADFCEAISQQRRGGQVRLLPPLIPRDRGPWMPASGAQKGLWVVQQLQGPQPNATYHISLTLRLKGRLDVGILEKCWSILVGRHEAFRTHFEQRDGDPVQVITSPGNGILSFIDLSQSTQGDLAEKANLLVEKVINNPISLASGPLHRFVLLRLDGETHLLVLVVHHIVFDGWSLRILLKELSQLYEDLVEKRKPQLTELGVQHADFAHWQQQLLLQGSESGALTFWRRYLADAPPLLELPLDRPRPATARFRGGTETFSVKGAYGRYFDRFKGKAPVTGFILLETTLAVLLSKYSGQDTLLVGTPVSNRRFRELEPVVGFFVNMLVLRHDFPIRCTFREALDHTRQMLLEAHAHQDIPLEKVVETVRPSRGLSHNPLFQVMFAIDSASSEPEGLKGLQVSPFTVKNNTAKFDLSLTVSEDAGGLVGAWEYDADLFHPATIRTLSRHFLKLLQLATSDPDQPIAALCLLEDWEKREILTESQGANKPPLTVQTNSDPIRTANRPVPGQGRPDLSLTAKGPGSMDLPIFELLVRLFGP